VSPGKREVLVRFPCACGQELDSRTDRAAKPHMRTVQCPKCKAVYFVRVVVTAG
jgi:hypothetical protein